jgi:hypothetical protein
MTGRSCACKEEIKQKKTRINFRIGKKNVMNLKAEIKQNL